MLYLLVLVLLLGFAPAFIAHSKGRSFFPWWFYGTMLGPVAMLHAMMMRDRRAERPVDRLVRDRDETGSPWPIVVWFGVALVIAAGVVFAYREFVPPEFGGAAEPLIATRGLQIPKADHLRIPKADQTADRQAPSGTKPTNGAAIAGDAKPPVTPDYKTRMRSSERAAPPAPTPASKPKSAGRRITIPLEMAKDTPPPPTPAPTAPVATIPAPPPAAPKIPPAPVAPVQTETTVARAEPPKQAPPSPPVKTEKPIALTPPARPTAPAAPKTPKAAVPAPSVPVAPAPWLKDRRKSAPSSAPAVTPPPVRQAAPTKAPTTTPANPITADVPALAKLDPSRKATPPETPAGTSAQNPVDPKAQKAPATKSEAVAVGELVLIVQRGLVERGYDPGPVNGRAHKQTQKAIRDFQSDRGLKPTGAIDHTLLRWLNVVGPKIKAFRTPPSVPPGR